MATAPPAKVQRLPWLLRYDETRRELRARSAAAAKPPEVHPPCGIKHGGQPGREGHAVVVEELVFDHRRSSASINGEDPGEQHGRRPGDPELICCRGF